MKKRQFLHPLETMRRREQRLRVLYGELSKAVDATFGPNVEFFLAGRTVYVGTDDVERFDEFKAAITEIAPEIDSIGLFEPDELDVPKRYEGHHMHRLFEMHKGMPYRLLKEITALNQYF